MNFESKLFWQGREVLISGGTGSLGKAITNLLIQEEYPIKGLRIFSRDELKQYQMRQSLKAPFPVAFLIGDIRNRKRLTRAMEGVDTCIHAAALKQVDTSESNPWEFIETNIIGTQNVLDACLDCKVARAMLISTDKASYPINLYGMTKGCAERIFVHGNIYSGGRIPIFGACRYGNVLGSRGSVIQVFQEQALNGQIITITDSQMTRFWITMKDVARFILQSIEIMQAGEIYIPKMPSMKIVDLAKTIIAETGTMGKSKIEEIGVRPGEKLHETLVTKEESYKCDVQDTYYLIHPVRECPPETVRALFSYTSDNNDWWLTKKELWEMIK